MISQTMLTLPTKTMTISLNRSMSLKRKQTRVRISPPKTMMSNNKTTRRCSHLKKTSPHLRTESKMKAKNKQQSQWPKVTNKWSSKTTKRRVRTKTWTNQSKKKQSPPRKSRTINLRRKTPIQAARITIQFKTAMTTKMRGWSSTVKLPLKPRRTTQTKVTRKRVKKRLSRCLSSKKMMTSKIKTSKNRTTRRTLKTSKRAMSTTLVTEPRTRQ